MTANLQHEFDTASPQAFKGMSHTSRAKMLATKQQNPYTHTDESRALIRDALKGRAKTAEHKARVSQAKKGRPRSAEACARTSATLLANPPRVKPIQTPWGVFPRLHDAVAHARAQGVKNPRNKIVEWTKTQPDQYYFLPRDTK